MQTVQVNLGPSSYSLQITPGLLDDLQDLLPPAEGGVVITDEAVDALYGRSPAWDLTMHKIVIAPGEEEKNLQTAAAILDRMQKSGLTRHSIVVALGGGVVGDLAGFCASVYMRGIPYIQVPTTLLAQVDSAVGGKTGVNLPGGKNMVGSFYQPQGVFIDPRTLQTLPQRHFISGLAEVIKYGLAWDYAFFCYLQEHLSQLLALEEEILTEVIKRCCEIKAEVVAQDEKEHGVRKVLNCGHTIGHALEAVTFYKQYTHGEAVFVGLYLETRMAEGLGLIDSAQSQAILTLLGRTGAGLTLKEGLWTKLIRAMLADKKNRSGKISFMLPAGPGRVTEVLLIAEEVMELLETIATQ
ncbi:MAG: 3-dehydroquinate synthase [Bacillota bacterium]|jgi:3-dehydroquinate synthase|nr:3-dehydroquinate synthase [Bacillota bacterium]HHT90401.1 3-dehydroquinate synthase [Bacillota bacterium]